MKRKQIGFLACRILSIYALIEATRMLQAFTGIISTTIPNESKLSLSLSTFLPFLLMVAVAVVLWRWAKPLSELMDTEGQKENEENPISGTEIQVIAFSILGVYVLIKGIPATVGDVGNYYLIFHKTQINGGLMTTHKLRIAIDVLQVLLGVGLTFGSRGLVRMIHNLRTAGNQGKGLN